MKATLLDLIERLQSKCKDLILYHRSIEKRERTRNQVGRIHTSVAEQLRSANFQKRISLFTMLNTGARGPTATQKLKMENAWLHDDDDDTASIGNTSILTQQAGKRATRGMKKKHEKKKLLANTFICPPPEDPSTARASEACAWQGLRTCL